MWHTAEFTESLFDLHLGTIDMPGWLQQMVDRVQCNAACAVSWTTGDPTTVKTDCSRNHIQLGNTWLSWVDNLVRDNKPDHPGLLEDIVREAGTTDDSDNSPLANPNLMIAYLDSSPAITLLFLRSINKPDGWSDDDRSYLRWLLPTLLKAHLVHKKIVLAENWLAMAQSALNGVPRKIISMTPIGELIRANEAGYELLEGKSFCVKNGLMTINQASVMQQFRDKLAEIRILGRDSLHNFVWNRSFHSTADKQNYQLMLKVHDLPSWALESSNYDRFVTLMVATPDIAASPTSEQLRDFFDLSNAQARVVLALLEGNDVITSATKLHISINTMRSHMRAIYAKMGVNNQSDLLRLLAGTLVDY